jgi:hypothetical protein
VIEDLPGVTAEAWVRVFGGLAPSEPYTQGFTTSGGQTGRGGWAWPSWCPCRCLGQGG